MAHRETDSPVALRTPPRILIYDPGRSAVELIDAIADWGYSVEAAHTLDDGLEQFHQRDFPVVLVRTDEQATNLEFPRSLKASRHVIFLAITTCMNCESAVKSLRAGMRDYILWPGRTDEIREALARSFEEVEVARFQDDMLSMLMHDIKIPLSSILGYSTLIVDKESGELHPKTPSFARIINSSGLKILTLLDNFLTTSKIDCGRLHLCLTNLRLQPFLEDLADTFHAELERHNLRLLVSCDGAVPAVEADEGMMFRAMGNLLSNACKFSPPHSEITISTARSRLESLDGEESPAVVIEVCNPGPGLTPSEIPEIFERFRRGRAQGTIEGSGLGTYVVKSIVEAHGGKVAVESVPNQLTRFMVYLPLKACNTAEDWK